MFYFLLATLYASTAYYVWLMADLSPILQADARFTKGWHWALSLGWPLMLPLSLCFWAAQKLQERV